MPKSRKRTTKKTRNVAAFRQKVMQQTPLPVLKKQMLQAFPWLRALNETDREDAATELAHLTVAAAGGDMTAADNLQSGIDYWQQIAALDSAP